MKRPLLIVAGAAILAGIVRPAPVLSHETLTTTVLFDREIVRILDDHCVMCHMEDGPSFPLETYEQTWLRRRAIRAAVIARHMPPWPAVSGYGTFANDNGLTLREIQFVVGWVEGLGPRNAGTVFTNTADSSLGRPAEVRAQAHTGHWRLGEPGLVRPLAARTIAAGSTNTVQRTVVDLGLTAPRRVRALEYMPGDRRVVRAAFFTVEETGQWIGSWTPWHPAMELPAGAAFRVPAGAHIVAEIHYQGAGGPVVDRGIIGLFFDGLPAGGAADPQGRATPPRTVSDLVLEATGEAAGSGSARRLRAEVRLPADTLALALRSEATAGITSIEVSARNPDGGTEVLLFAKDFQADWPTPFIFEAPVRLHRGATLSVTAYDAGTPAAPAPGRVRLTISRY